MNWTVALWLACVAVSVACVWINRALVADKRRLDWLDAHCKGQVVEGQTYSDPYGEYVANDWHLEWPAGNIRDAIDAAAKL